ncbi:spore coat protein A [Marinobacterium nitratireducens]|uniref:Spore coat protein A n=1 Tax=Marinobacterium nitratireducens TaxID=518897 RepID=A0A917ZBT5_9GAMM|nr:multicopper oxidase domain-containing protein [Marinobacterium nitratireducens]GGO80465.1 spore coat protein A [Marinobacterium nitratireducens]
MKRRDFLTLSIRSAMAAGLTASIPAALLRAHSSHAAILAAGLSDPAMQPLFKQQAPNALAPGFKYMPEAGRLRIRAARAVQMTGLIGADGKKRETPIWGYGAHNGPVTWPGRTLELTVGPFSESLEISWENDLIEGSTLLNHLLPVDTSLHWAYSLPGYESYNIAIDGVPIVTHVHGGLNDSAFDGNPEYFFTPRFRIKGPRWEARYYRYGGPEWNDVAGTCWYHDHALGITRLNVYAGLAGFFILRDEHDTGTADNPLGLPAAPYELGFAVQDRMFRDTGELFYPAFPGDPFYSDFIDDEGADLPAEIFPNGGPTALAEFFGDHMLVNGVIWPNYRVERRQYRVRLLNGCDSRFMRLRLKAVPGGAPEDDYWADGATDPALGDPIPFYVIGSDQSLRATAAEVHEVNFAPGERLDLVIDFKAVENGDRVIIENLLGDAPFGGNLPKRGDLFPDRRTDRIMAFDVVLETSSVPDTAISESTYLSDGVAIPGPVAKTRKLALFEGTDRFGRLKPLLGTAEPVLDVAGNWVNGTLDWDSPITENPALGDIEIWEIYNATGDAHPIHVHLVHFEILDRQPFSARLIEKSTELGEGGEDDQGGEGYRLENLRVVGQARGPEPQEQTRRDMVMALPGEVTRIKMRFDKPGRFVWHCHILSHEDHEMMRPYHVGEP